MKLFIVNKHSGKTRKYNQECYQNILFQGANIEICEVICLLSIFLITNGIADHDSRSLPESVRWLHKVYNYSNYARYVLIKWYLKGKAYITDILTQDKPNEKEKVIFSIVLGTNRYFRA